MLVRLVEFELVTYLKRDSPLAGARQRNVTRLDGLGRASLSRKPISERVVGWNHRHFEITDKGSLGWG